MTKFRIGAGLGLAAGYYLGARAGRHRYDQLNRLGAWVSRRSATIEHAATAVGRARAVVDLGKVRVHDAVERPVLAASR